ncbi:MAG: hypothetical protein LBT54_02990 [Bifidobacteriaceae bacterium]|nr:hypothetical protein [Bifidobacteriaceae bacterium]
MALSAVGLWAVLAGFLDTDVTEPLDHPLQLAFAVLGAAAVVVLQAVLAHLAGQSHNRVRYARWRDGLHWKSDLPDEAPWEDVLQEGRNKAIAVDTVAKYRSARNWQLAALGLVTAAASAAVFVRGYQAMDQLDLEGIIRIALYVVFGAAPPAFAALAFTLRATDGTEMSRRRARLTADLGSAAAANAGSLAAAKTKAATARGLSDHLWEKGINGVVTELQQTLDDAVPAFCFAETQIGCAPTEIAEQQLVLIKGDRARTFGASMCCGIPGAAKLDIELIAAKLDTLEGLDRRLAETEERIAACPAYPWAPAADHPART